jgi:hypothetical protein
MEELERGFSTELSFDKTTPGTVLFKENLDAGPPTIRNIYIAKHLAKDFKRVKVTVEFLDNGKG